MARTTDLGRGWVLTEVLCHVGSALSAKMVDHSPGWDLTGSLYRANPALLWVKMVDLCQGSVLTESPCHVDLVLHWAKMVDRYPD